MKRPVDMFCKNCQSQPGKKCTQPTDTSRTAVNWFHTIREDDAAEANREEKTS